MADGLILAIDQGTTRTRAFLFDRAGAPLASTGAELDQIYPRPGWVEHDPLEIWRLTRDVTMAMVDEAGGARHIVSVGITNQRETTLLWDRATGEPLYNAIVWQDRRTADLCRRLAAEGFDTHVRERTGLVLDPYFSATKLAWLLDNVDGARARAERGELCFGTVESWLVWNLSGGTRHVTDASNACRTLLYDIHRGDWDDEMLRRLSVPRAVLPEVVACDGDIAETVPGLFGGTLQIAGMAGDQHAALIGQACFAPGTTKATYGTGCFVLTTTGADAVRSSHGLLTTLGWRRADSVSYALEGSIFMAGATLQWLRDGLGLFTDYAEAEAMIACAEPQSGVYLVPAFAGLGAPYWDADARGAIVGLTRGAGAAEIVRAGLEAVAFQTRDLLAAFAADLATAGIDAPDRLRVDGGMARNDWLLQAIADQTGLVVERSRMTDATVLGAACLAGLGAGVFTTLDEIAGNWSAERSFEPRMSADEREARHAGWRGAVARVLSDRGPGPR